MNRHELSREANHVIIMGIGRGTLKYSGPEMGMCMRMRKESSAWSSVNWGIAGDEVRVVAGFYIRRQAGPS